MPFFSDEISVFNIIVLVVALLEGLVYIQSLFGSITANRINKYMSWGRFNRLIKSLANKIISSHRKYDLIVAYGRGGAICAGCLSSYLGSIPILILDREYSIINGNKIANFYESQIILDKSFSYLKNGKILLLSQQSDPGITLKTAEIVLKNSGFINIDKYAILKSEKSTDIDLIDFAYEYSSGRNCKKFPWEKSKNYKDVMNRQQLENV